MIIEILPLSAYICLVTCFKPDISSTIVSFRGKSWKFQQFSYSRLCFLFLECIVLCSGKRYILYFNPFWQWPTMSNHRPFIKKSPLNKITESPNLCYVYTSLFFKREVFALCIYVSNVMKWNILEEELYIQCPQIAIHGYC